MTSTPIGHPAGGVAAGRRAVRPGPPGRLVDVVGHVGHRPRPGADRPRAPDGAAGCRSGPPVPVAGGRRPDHRGRHRVGGAAPAAGYGRQHRADPDQAAPIHSHTTNGCSTTPNVQTVPAGRDGVDGQVEVVPPARVDGRRADGLGAGAELADGRVEHAAVVDPEHGLECRVGRRGDLAGADEGDGVPGERGRLALGQVQLAAVEERGGRGQPDGDDHHADVDHHARRWPGPPSPATRPAPTGPARRPRHARRGRHRGPRAPGPGRPRRRRRHRARRPAAARRRGCRPAHRPPPRPRRWRPGTASRPPHHLDGGLAPGQGRGHRHQEQQGQPDRDEEPVEVRGPHRHLGAVVRGPRRAGGRRCPAGRRRRSPRTAGCWPGRPPPG